MDRITKQPLGLLLIVFLYAGLELRAQGAPDRETLELLQHRNYAGAAARLDSAISSQPDHPLLNYYAGLCYLHARSLKPRAVGYLEKATELSG